ncbi:hypothetical protein EYF80_019565 [Liparis tanakae]|uniref:Uncharacterized protein n=1 Tax=Liparis tanakae TaxID=230148 RepID=A0A4Z2HYW8_9TELE|nr:hypothetical protein EYF80_019565 [Liparis tanakae]
MEFKDVGATDLGHDLHPALQHLCGAMKVSSATSEDHVSLRCHDSRLSRLERTRSPHDSSCGFKTHLVIDSHIDRFTRDTFSSDSSSIQAPVDRFALAADVDLRLELRQDAELLLWSPLGANTDTMLLETRLYFWALWRRGKP